LSDATPGEVLASRWWPLWARHPVWSTERYESWFGVEFEFLLHDVTCTCFEGKAKRIWVMDRGIVSEENLNFLRQRQARYLAGTTLAANCVCAWLPGPTGRWPNSSADWVWNCPASQNESKM